MASTKIPKASPVAGLSCSGRPFLFGDLFLWASKEKSHSAAAADEDQRFAMNRNSLRL